MFIGILEKSWGSQRTWRWIWCFRLHYKVLYYKFE